MEITRNNKYLKKFIHISTDEVYGDMDEHIAINHTSTETDELKPSSYYSATKAASVVKQIKGATIIFLTKKYLYYDSRIIN